jgi:hypothetical protein
MQLRRNKSGQQATEDRAAPELLVGADQIANFLGITKRQVYAMREAGHPLVRNEPGLGLVASRQALKNRFAIEATNKSR